MTDLTPTDPAPAVPAVPVADAPAAPVVVPATAPDGVVAPVEVAPHRSRGLGRFALFLGIIAFLGDIGVLVFAVIQVASFAQTLDVQNGLTLLAGFAALAFIIFWAGIIVGGLAVLLGLIAAISNRGRAPGIVGLILGLLVLLSHIGVGLAVLSAGSGISNLGS